MSYDAQSVDDLTALYEKQSPKAFIVMAMEGLPPSDHAERYDKGDHDGITKCDYSCCNDRGLCTDAKGHACFVGCIVVCCICCCYATNGFNGLWTYWPF